MTDFVRSGRRRTRPLFLIIIVLFCNGWGRLPPPPLVLHTSSEKNRHFPTSTLKRGRRRRRRERYKFSVVVFLSFFRPLSFSCSFAQRWQVLLFHLSKKHARLAVGTVCSEERKREREKGVNDSAISPGVEPVSLLAAKTAEITPFFYRDGTVALLSWVQYLLVAFLYFLPNQPSPMQSFYFPGRRSHHAS